MNPRSYLYVPADSADRLSKSVTRGADALVIDLEDGVAPVDKGIARINAKSWLESVKTSSEIWVRINQDSFEQDLREIVHPKVQGVVVAKAANASHLENVAENLTRHEKRVGIPGQLAIIPLVESAEGILNLAEIAKCPRVIRLMLGEEDLQADLGLPRLSDGRVLDLARNLSIIACAAAGIAAPIAPVEVDFTDLTKFEESTGRFLRQGFFGRACIHPAQLEIVNRAFMPSAEDVEWAKDVLARMESANGGATVDSQGKMIDEAIARRARRILQNQKN